MRSRTESARLRIHDSLTRGFEEKYGCSSNQSNGSHPAALGPSEVQDFDALVDAVMADCASTTIHADPQLCRRFVEQRLHLELLELQEAQEDEAEKHIQPFNEQEVRMQRYARALERQKDAEDAERERWRAWCREHPQDPPPRHVSAMKSEVQRQQRKLERLGRKLTQPYLEEAAAEAARKQKMDDSLTPRRIEASWKTKGGQVTTEGRSPRSSTPPRSSRTTPSPSAPARGAQMSRRVRFST